MWQAMEDVKTVHLEITTRCNLACPQCARTMAETSGIEMPKEDFNLDDAKRVFTKEFSQQLKSVYICGNYGDPIATSATLPILRYLREQGIPSLKIYTNGSARNKEWWKELASIMSTDKDWCFFSIDGLRDTNHVYRIRSNWDIIMRSAETFINSGGQAVWDFIFFDHNMHQVEEIIKTAKELGFKRLRLRKTNRFIESLKRRKSEDSTFTQEELQEIHKATTISAEKSSAKSLDLYNSIISKYGSFLNYIDATSIKCKTQLDNSIYIDHKACVWPCCWVGAPRYFVDPNNPQKEDFDYLTKKYGTGFNSLREHSLEEIINHVWFKIDLEDSWQNKRSSLNRKLYACGRTCGTMYEFSSGVNSTIINLEDNQ